MRLSETPKVLESVKRHTLGNPALHNIAGLVTLLFVVFGGGVSVGLLKSEIESNAKTIIETKGQLENLRRSQQNLLVQQAVTIATLEQQNKMLDQIHRQVNGQN